MAVTGIEAVQTAAGRFNCYKVEMRAIGQTFWIGVEGARPLVKLQAGNVEADLVKVWTTNVMDTVLASLNAAGWRDLNSPLWSRQGAEREASIGNPDDQNQRVAVTVRKVYTAKAEIGQALQKSVAKTKESGWELVPESVERFEIGGQQALRCVVRSSPAGSNTIYFVWIRTESTAVEFKALFRPPEFTVFRWKFDPVLATVKVP
jgi:hypothetical protein